MGSTPKKRIDELSVELRQLAQRDRELDLKEREITKSPWSNPLVAALAAGVLALSGNVVVSIFNGQAQRTVEKEKARGNLLLEAIKTGDVQAATCNLDFLVESGLLPAEDYQGLKNYTDKYGNECEGAVLPSPEGKTVSASQCDSSLLPTAETIADARAAAEKVGTSAWLSVALGEVGVCERTSSGKERIRQYWASLTERVTSDAEGYWSASFVNWVFKSAQITPQDSAAGYVWQMWGEPTDTPIVGTLVIAVSVKDATLGKATFTNPGPRLIGFYLGEEDGKVMVLAGNVTDQVTVIKIAKDRIVAYRNPASSVGE